MTLEQFTQRVGEELADVNGLSAGWQDIIALLLAFIAEMPSLNESNVAQLAHNDLNLRQRLAVRIKAREALISSGRSASGAKDLAEAVKAVAEAATPEEVESCYADVKACCS